MLESYFAWFVAGFVLLIAELLTGTFYLLVLGTAAFAGGVIAWFSAPFWLQVLGAALVAMAGVVWVRGRRADATAAMASLDLGQAVTLDSWINLPARHARVRYRDTLWDAFVQRDDAAPAGNVGDVFYIVSVDGNTLTVARDRPG